MPTPEIPVLNTGVLFPSFALIVADVFDCALPGSYKNRPYNRDYSHPL
ncbi:major fimbrial subunit [Salmonella enterica subsp. enterica serovar Typhi str. P-stx-12]|nr:major fimbrial subunit [Salmonella enterica subsp. enterica serovar Typhi str. P-stx-12]AXR55257.1 putative major fimbrial subunit [Salmonella enterica subsp. enterica serovar Typhi]